MSSPQTSANGYTRVELADLPTLGGLGDAAWAPVRHALNIGAFGVNAFTAAHSGGVVIEEHDEANSGHEELYVVLGGHAEFTLDGDKVDAPAGTLVLVRDPAINREARACQPGTTILAVGGTPGQAFEPQEWERRRTAALDA